MSNSGAKDLWRTFSACLAIANFWYLSAWREVEVLFLVRTNYFRKAPATLDYFTSVVLSVLLVATALFVTYILLARCLPRHTRTFVTVGVGVLLAMCAYRWPSYNVTLRVIAAGVPLVGAALALRFPGQRLTSTTGHLLVGASLLFFVQSASSLWAWHRAMRPLSQFADHGPAPRQARQAAQRVVWVIFDELDYELVFPLRPADVELPHLDRLRNESFFSTKAFAPAALTTKSFPSFLIGRVVSEVNESKADDAELTFAPNKEVGRWATYRNLFSDLRKQGWDAGLVGWHNPYCRVIGDDLADCEWEPNLDAYGALLKEYSVLQIGLTPVDAIIHGQPRRLLRPGPAEGERYDLLRDGHVRQYEVTMAHARRLATDANLDVVLIHCLIPHPPGIYNRTRDRIDTKYRGNYFDNLELMDHTLGELRRELDSSGLWDSTTFIVTSDHYLRRFVWSHRPVWTAEEDRLTKRREQPRVPFLIRFAHSTQPVTYDTAFNTVLIHDLVPKLMHGEITDAASVSRWLDVNRGRFPAKTMTSRKELER